MNFSLEGKKVIFAAVLVLLLAVTLSSPAQIANAGATSHDVGTNAGPRLSNTISIELGNPPRGGDYDSGDDVVIDGTFSRPVSGTVTLTFTRPDGSTFTRTTSATDGSFTYTYAAIGVGDWSVVASFNGNDTYESSKSPILSFVLAETVSTAGIAVIAVLFWLPVIGGLYWWTKKRKKGRISKNEEVIWSRQEPAPAEAPPVAATQPVPVPPATPADEEVAPQEKKPRTKPKAEAKPKAVKSKKSTIEVNFCPSCGIGVDEGAEFCHKCGAELR